MCNSFFLTSIECSMEYLHHDSLFSWSCYIKKIRTVKTSHQFWVFLPTTTHFTIESTKKTQNKFGDKYCPVVSFSQDYSLVICQSSYLFDLWFSNKFLRTAFQKRALSNPMLLLLNHSKTTMQLWKHLENSGNLSETTPVKRHLYMHTGVYRVVCASQQPQQFL